MKVIKEKIRQTKIGAKNPMARKIKRINIKTNETISVTTSTLKNVKINTKEHIILER